MPLDELDACELRTLIANRAAYIVSGISMNSISRDDIRNHIDRLKMLADALPPEVKQ